MKSKKVDPASRPDHENPEWTEEEMRRARPALDVIAEVFGEKAADVFYVSDLTGEKITSAHRQEAIRRELLGVFDLAKQASA